jgi:hypothetical protein
MLLHSCIAMGTTRPKLGVADIFRAYGDEYRRRYPVTDHERRVMWAIEHCRTATMGGFLEQCDTCGKFRIRYCS